MVGPILGVQDAKWYAISTAYLQVGETGPREEVRKNCLPWLYRLARYTNKSIRELWCLRARGAALVVPLLEERKHACEGGKGKREYAVHFLFDSQQTTVRALTPD